MPWPFIEQALRQRHHDGYLRDRAVVEYEKDGLICVNGEHFLNFASNDYLGMRHEHSVLQAWVNGLAQFGAGSGASPLVTGYSQAHMALENYLAEALQRDAVLLFNSGFAANQALCQALFCDVDDGCIITDKYMHASFIDGALASKAQLKRYKHNDMAHMETLFAQSPGQHRLLASEGVFSMDGDSAPVAELVEASQRFDCPLMLDDAHGFGVLGENGFGTAEQYQLTQQDLPILMGTFGKAVGTAGAFVAGSHELIEYLVNYARHYIYSTALPPAQAVATLQSLVDITQNDKREKLHQNIALFRELASRHQLPLVNSSSAIQPLIIGSPERCVLISEALRARGIWVPAIRYPTVPKNTDRLRITLSANHSAKDIEVLIDAINLVLENHHV